MQNVVIKKIDLYMDFAAGVSLSEAQNPMPPPLPYTLYMCIKYTYSHRKGGDGGRAEPERRLEARL
jgi:hypothetical protein